VPGQSQTLHTQIRIGRRQRWHSISRHGSPWTPDQAREEAKRLLSAVATANDPAATRAHQRTVIDLKELGHQWLEYNRNRCKPTTYDVYSRNLEARIYPALGKYRVTDIVTPDILKLHDKMAETPLSGEPRGSDPVINVHVGNGT
jgi:Phage integrase, N-terminal SAM-like domain